MKNEWREKLRDKFKHANLGTGLLNAPRHWGAIYKLVRINKHFAVRDTGRVSATWQATRDT